MPSDFQLYQFTFVLRFLEYTTLPPQKGGTFRGTFGQAFKRAVCLEDNLFCKNCSLEKTCAYAAVFEPQIDKEEQLSAKREKFFARIEDIPRPFILSCLSVKTDFQPNDLLTVELTLVGDTLKYLPYFIYCFEMMGKMGLGKKRGKFNLHRVVSQRLGYQDQVIYLNAKPRFENCLPPFKYSELEGGFSNSSNRLCLDFLTPTRLKFSGKLAGELKFHILIRNLLRRISFLYYFYQGKVLNIDINSLTEAAREITVSSNLNWLNWQRYSNRQQAKICMGGLTGVVCYEGNLEQFLTIICLGSYIHVGKGTVFGLGKYEIIEKSNS